MCEPAPWSGRSPIYFPPFPTRKTFSPLLKTYLKYVYFGRRTEGCIMNEVSNYMKLFIVSYLIILAQQSYILKQLMNIKIQLKRVKEIYLV